LAIANQLQKQSDGLLQANKNANDAIGLVKIADSAMEEYQTILSTIRDKSLQAASDTNSPAARAALNTDVQALVKQAQDISQNTEFNGIKLLNGSFTNKLMQVGASSGQTLSISIANTDTTAQGINALDLTTQAGATAAITSLDAAIKAIDTIRGGIGSNQSALESRVRVNSLTQANVKAAESQIRDVDYAKVQSDLTKMNIKEQANVFSLKQTFQNQQQVLGLLR